MFNKHGTFVLKQKKKLENLHSSAKHTHIKMYTNTVSSWVFSNNLLYMNSHSSLVFSTCEMIPIWKPDIHLQNESSVFSRSVFIVSSPTSPCFTLSHLNNRKNYEKCWRNEILNWWINWIIWQRYLQARTYISFCLIDQQQLALPWCRANTVFYAAGWICSFFLDSTSDSHCLTPTGSEKRAADLWTMSSVSHDYWMLFHG